jgi:GDSL-like Lipase/Acylhydrolase family
MKKSAFFGLFIALLICSSAYPQPTPAVRHIPAKTPVGFESEISAFLKQDSVQFPPAGAYLFTGSSTIRKWENLAADFAEIPVIHRGFGGSTMKALDYYAGYIVLPYKPRTIVVYEGDNDLAAGATPAEVVALCDTFIRKVHTELPKTMIWFMSVKPSFARKNQLALQQETNRRLKALIRKKKKTRFIDITPLMYGRDGKLRRDLFESDSLHVNKECYRIWAGHMKRVMGIGK